MSYATTFVSAALPVLAIVKRYGAVRTRVDLGNLAGRDEVCVLVTLDFLRDVHCRGGCNVECRIGRAQVVLSGAIAVDIEASFSRPLMQ